MKKNAEIEDLAPAVPVRTVRISIRPKTWLQTRKFKILFFFLLDTDPNGQSEYREVNRF